VSNTIIDNVGGPRPNLGVASEATLQALVEAVNRKGVGQPGQGQRIQEVYNRSISEGTKEVGIFTKAVKSTGRAALNFTKELAFGGDRVSDFTSAVFGAEGAVTTLTRFIEKQVDTFRDLSSVGASFNNSLFDLIAASANSSMNMDEFAQMVRLNSGAFAGFGSSVTGGAKVFGEFSKQFRTGIGQRFFEMGFTINDINDSLINYLDIETRRTSRNLRTDKQQQEAAAGYITSLDLLTKLTGKQRKEYENAMATQVQDAGIRSQLNRLQGQELENFRAGLAFLDTEMGPLGDGLKDLMDGVAQTDMGKALLNQLPGIGEFAKKMFEGGASMEEIVDQLGNNFGPQLESLSDQITKPQLDQMRMQGGINAAIAEMLDNAYRLNKTKMLDVKAAQEEQKKREKLTSAFGKFEQTIINIRKAFIDTFFELGESTGLFDALKELGDAFLSLTGPSTDGLSKIVPGLKSMLGNTLTFFTNMIKKFTNWIKEGNLQTYIDSLSEKFNSFGNYISELTERFKNESLWDIIKDEVTKGFGGLKDFWNGPTMTKISENISNWFKDLLFGKEVEVGKTGTSEVRLERHGGLIKTITDGFSKIFDAATLSLATMIGLDTASGADPYLHQVLQRIGLDTAPESDSYLNQILQRIGLDTELDADPYLHQILQRIGLDTAPGADTYLDQIKNKILDAFLGKEVMVGREDGRQLERQGGLFESMANAFSNFWEGPTGTKIADTIINFFKNLVDNLILSINESSGGLLFGDASAEILKGRKAAGEILTPAQKSTLQEERYEEELDELSEAVVGTTSLALAGVDSLANGLYRLLGVQDHLTADMSGYLDRWSRSDRGLSWLTFGRSDDQAQPNKPETTPFQEEFSHATGTNGFKNFGSKSYGALHGVEAVVPRNTPAGELLQMFYDSQNSSARATETPASNFRSDTNQTTLIKKLDELNNSMLTVAALLETGLGVQNKTMRSVKGIGMDYYRGIGR
jgi:hypothetical protein